MSPTWTQLLSPRLKDLLQDPHRLQTFGGLPTGRDAAVVADDRGQQLPATPARWIPGISRGCARWMFDLAYDSYEPLAYLFGMHLQVEFLCQHVIASGNVVHSNWKWQFRVSFPINSMVMFHRYVKLPEGNHSCSMWGSIPTAVVGSTWVKRHQQQNLPCQRQHQRHQPFLWKAKARNSSFCRDWIRIYHPTFHFHWWSLDAVGLEMFGWWSHFEVKNPIWHQ